MNRNKIFILIITLTTFHFASGQINYSEQIFSNTHGIKQEKTTFFEIEGYDIFIQLHKTKYNDKGIEKLKRKYSIPKDDYPFIDSTLQTNKYFITTNQRNDEIVQSSVYYFLPIGQGEIKVVGLQTLMSRDEQLEKFFVHSIIENTVPNNVFTAMTIDSIKFADRYISLGPACHWMRTHNIQCPNLGQMNWGEFRTLERAKEMVETQQKLNDDKSIAKILEQNEIDIIFEGQETKAIKVIYKFKIPQLVMGGSNILITYYIASKVRNKYVGCVLSHYTDDVNADNLPPLLSEVMELKE